MKNRAIIFTTDQGYLIPTLVAAEQVLSQPKVAAIADVLIFLIGIPAADLAALKKGVAGKPIAFVEMNDEAFRLPAGVHFEQSHVPKTALARFMTPALIPDQYEHILYLDGDIQVVGDIEPLVAHNVEPGKILSANDQLFLMAPFLGAAGRAYRRHMNYLASIGLKRGSDYFNSGILAADSKTWADICARAMAYFLNNSQRCLYHDQSALNATNVSRREVLSSNYNYITPFTALGMDTSNVRIFHFTGGIKPWKKLERSLWPEWLQKPYVEIFASYPELQHYAANLTKAPAVPSPPRLRGLVAQAITSIFARARFAKYMRSTPFAVD